MSSIRIRRTDSGDSNFLFLVSSLSALLSDLNGERDSFYVQHNKASSLSNTVVAYLDGRPVGCGGFRQVRDGVVEIKRMFVSPELRGKGIGGEILRELESWARELGYGQAILETSKRLHGAVQLYTKSGYEVIPNYEPYVGVDDSVCMRRVLEGVRERDLETAQAVES